MKILQVITQSDLGGAQTVVVNLANKLCENNEVIVAAGDDNGKMFPLLKPEVKIEHIPSLVRNLSPLKELRAISQMKKLYRKYKPDIIHLHSSKAGILGRLAFPKNKIIYTVHGFDSIRIAHRKYLPLERSLQKRCSAIVGVSKYDFKNLRSEGIDNNVEYVYNGIFRPFPLVENPFEQFRKFKKIILCIARLSPQKNHELFIETAKLIPDAAFLWIGNLQEPDFTKPNNVFFLGNITNAGSYAKYADVLVLPSNFEGLPIVIIEALACGTPVVASAVGGVPEILDGTNGYALENNAVLFAEKIKYILGSQDRINEMSANAVKSYDNSFTVDQMVSGYLAIYNKIYNQNNS